MQDSSHELGKHPLVNTDCDRKLVYLDPRKETYPLPLRLLVRGFFTGALVAEALVLAILMRPADFPAFCLLRAMAVMVRSGLRLGLQNHIFLV